jgi:hypothetical protein
MITREPRSACDPSAASPRIPDRILARHPHSTCPPAPHTAEEVSALIAALHVAGVSTLTIGHGRYTVSRTTAAAVSEAWSRAGGTILGIVDWPARAASWLKAARQMVQSHPDAWVIVDNPAGCAQLAARLAEHEDWSPARTFGTASMDNPDAAALSGFGVLTGMRGVTADGGTWRIGHGILLRARRQAEPMTLFPPSHNLLCDLRSGAVHPRRVARPALATCARPGIHPDAASSTTTRQCAHRDASRRRRGLTRACRIAKG